MLLSLWRTSLARIGLQLRSATSFPSFSVQMNGYEFNLLPPPIGYRSAFLRERLIDIRMLPSQAFIRHLLILINGETSRPLLILRNTKYLLILKNEFLILENKSDFLILINHFLILRNDHIY